MGFATASAVPMNGGLIKGSIQGCVKDVCTGKGVPCVTVRIYDQYKGLVAQTRTDCRGYYDVCLSPGATYYVTVCVPPCYCSVSPTTVRNVIVQTNQETSVNFYIRGVSEKIDG